MTETERTPSAALLHSLGPRRLLTASQPACERLTPDKGYLSATYQGDVTPIRIQDGCQ